jgi:hypothetical protein
LKKRMNEVVAKKGDLSINLKNLPYLFVEEEDE